MKHEEFMREAIRLAKDNVDSGAGGPFGAVIVKDGKIIARGQNLVTSTMDPTAHAEVVAIRRACETLNSFQLDGCTVYTSCEPCPMCLSAIYWARPEKVYFGCSKSDAAEINFDDAFIYDEIEKPASDRSIPSEQFLQNEAVEAFIKWEASDKKIPY